MKLKEKFVEIYDMFLKGQDPAQGRDPDVFWDELFLIKTLTIVLGEIFRKKFHNWSFDVIHLLSVDLAFEAVALLGLLANYNKHEIRNPYLQNISALGDDVILQKISMVIVHTCDRMRRSYIQVMDDDELSAVSRLTSALSYVTGMLWNPKGQDSSVTDTIFAQLPDGRVTVLLVFYDLIYTNKRFLDVFLSYSTGHISSAPSSPGGTVSTSSSLVENSDTGLGSFLSFASYLLQHNRTHRSAPYTHLCLIIILIIVEDPSSYPYLCSVPRSQDSLPSVSSTPDQAVSAMTNVRLCRQRQPVLPKVKHSRPMAAVLLDVILGFLKHNMKKKMQVDCFRIAIAIVFSLASRFKALRVRLPYHWAEMWNTLQGLVKFLQANTTTFQHVPEARDLVAETIDLVNYFVTFGDLIMPDPASLYALYYEIVRSGIDPFSDLTKEFSISVQPPLPAPLPHHDLTSRNRLNLTSTSISPVTTPTGSVLGSPTPAPASILASPPPSPYHNPLRPASPHSAASLAQQQRVIILCLSNINQVYTFFFTHLLAWRDANPTRSLGPDLVTTIIKNHYQDLTLVPLSLDAFLTQKQNVIMHHGGPRGHGGISSMAAMVPSPMSGSGPHPAWDGYSEVPGKVPFFRQLTRWVVSDFRVISKQNAASSVRRASAPSVAF
ncbi:hypothetical protein BGX28_004356 [Mortierella sp. GBA30]|nr:hypothetical protein BGX28_004356 [Mortierella sp. GBA30]